MDVGRHQFPERGIDSAVAGDGTEPCEPFADDVDTEMPSPVRGAGMTGVAMAFVLDLQSGRRQRRFQRLADGRDPRFPGQWPLTHGSTFRNGRTSTRW